MELAINRQPDPHSFLPQAEIEAFLREIGPTIGAVARAIALFGDDALELWVAGSYRESAFKGSPHGLLKIAC